jgi:hypothetical protein
VFLDHPVGMHFGRFDIRLIERVDSHEMSGDSRRHFPQKHLAAQIIGIINPDFQDRMSGGCQFGYS